MDLVNRNLSEVSVNDKEGRLAIRASIEEYEASMRQAAGSERGEMDEINDNGLTEFLVGGAYIRVLDIPAGVTIVSNLWLKERLWIIISGEVMFTTEFGQQHIIAPYIGKAPFGSKVALYAVTDTKWAAITGANTDNIEEMEDEIMAKDYSEFVYPWDLLEDKT